MAPRTPEQQRSTEKSRPSVFWVLAIVVVPIAGLLAKVRIRDSHKLPQTGAYVLAPNHHSEIDPITVAVAVWRMKRAPRFMAKESLFRVPVLGAALRATGMVPVQRGTSARAAKATVDAATDLVRHERGVIVYPEGTLTRDPGLWPMRGKTGAVRLALAAGIPLIPLAHWGEQQILPRYGKLRLWPPRRRVDVIVGDPIDLSDLVGREHEQAALVEGTRRLMDAIAALLGELRGETPPAERWNPAAHKQNETGRYEP